MSCDTKTGVCETTGNLQTQSNSPCHCNHDGCEDPIVAKMLMWKCSFHMAMKAAQVEVLKEKIKKSWAAKLDKEASAVLEVMEAKWKSMHAVEHAKEELMAKFHAMCKDS